jgi:4-amino-4-deoxy-L-arabinose transferase-like glycosyltransferase
MENLSGFFLLLIGPTFFLLIFFKYPQLTVILISAYVLRVVAAISHTFIISLPDGLGDALSFQQIAEGLAQLKLPEVIERFPGYGGGFGYPWLMGLIYLALDESVLLIQSINVIAGTTSVFFSYRLAKLCWNERAAIRAAWVVALFPTLIMYSALTLREAFIVLFLLYSLINVLHWHQNGRLSSMLLGFFGFLLAGFFHAGILVGAFIFAAIVVQKNALIILYALQRGYLNLSGVFVFCFVMASLLPYLLGYLDIPYLGSAHNVIDFASLLAQANRTQVGYAAYPEWLRPQDILDYLLLLPPKFLYFYVAPFPWDIRSLSHAIGFLDSILYLVLGWLILRNRSLIWANRHARILMLILIPLLVTYALGTSNFGTGIRHRSKFVSVLLVIAAPFISKFVVGRGVR